MEGNVLFKFLAEVPIEKDFEITALPVNHRSFAGSEVNLMYFELDEL